ncbi:hypothetical protein [Nocardia cyriacigeorgica]|uniref:hypothetical protein n=1 Tax=Nocardia cyriacigeorgica TaxID=135487 RepID=UPI0034DB134B
MNTIRTFATVVAADAVVLGALYAWDQYQQRTAQRPVTATALGQQLTPAEQAELDTLESAEWMPARAAYLDAVDGYNVDLLAGERRVELTQLSAQELVTEITRAKAQVRRARKCGPPAWERRQSDIDMWVAHLDALKAEFRNRYDRHQSLPTLDAAIIKAAYTGVTTSQDEWPAFGVSTEATTSKAGETSEEIEA